MGGDKTVKPIRTAVLHYSVPPVVGGVEAVIDAHAHVFLDAGYPVTVYSGRGEHESLMEGTELKIIPELDSKHPEILEINAVLERGEIPEAFESMRQKLADLLRPELEAFDLVIVHNLLTKHFNLPLTAALLDLVNDGSIRQCLAWCHDFSWTSPNSSDPMFPGFPWDLLKTPHEKIQYITISEYRQKELSQLMGLPPEKIDVIYNGVDPSVWFGLSPEGWGLVKRMDLLSGDVILLMPLRVTRAKNIEMAEKVLVEIKAQGYDPRLAVTGPPDPHNVDSLLYYQSLIDLRKRLGLEREMKFVFDSGPDPNEHYEIPQRVAADLVRVSDLVFMPSHREGFGMPVLEAGLIGVPVVTSDHVPAALEIGGKNVYLYNVQASPKEIARLILEEALSNKASCFRRQVRQEFTWESIFKYKIEPYLTAKSNV
jgi:mannosylglucosylglycerate synthase